MFDLCCCCCCLQEKQQAEVVERCQEAYLAMLQLVLNCSIYTAELHCCCCCLQEKQQVEVVERRRDVLPGHAAAEVVFLLVAGEAAG
jgi:hypothetical protein